MRNYNEAAAAAFAAYTLDTVDDGQLHATLAAWEMPRPNPVLNRALEALVEQAESIRLLLLDYSRQGARSGPGRQEVDYQRRQYTKFRDAIDLLEREGLPGQMKDAAGYWVPSSTSDKLYAVKPIVRDGVPGWRCDCQGGKRSVCHHQIVAEVVDQAAVRPLRKAA